MQRSFKEQRGRDLVLLTVTFDPQRDGPEKIGPLCREPESKRIRPPGIFLTGPVSDVQRVTNLFGIGYFPDEGLMNHSLHTTVIDRQGKLVANIEGHQFSADQLADLVQTVLRPEECKAHGSQIQLAQTVEESEEK